MHRPELSDDQVEFLCDLCDMWLDGYDEATADVVRDRTFDTPEEMLYAVSQMHKGFDTVTTVKEKLSACRASSTV